jgi:hypothetical protein
LADPARFVLRSERFVDLKNAAKDMPSRSIWLRTARLWRLA